MHTARLLLLTAAVTGLSALPARGGASATAPEAALESQLRLIAGRARVQALLDALAVNSDDEKALCADIAHVARHKTPVQGLEAARELLQKRMEGRFNTEITSLSASADFAGVPLASVLGADPSLLARQKAASILTSRSFDETYRKIRENVVKIAEADLLALIETTHPPVSLIDGWTKGSASWDGMLAKKCEKWVARDLETKLAGREVYDEIAARLTVNYTGPILRDVEAYVVAHGALEFAEANVPGQLLDPSLVEDSLRQSFGEAIKTKGGLLGTKYGPLPFVSKKVIPEHARALAGRRFVAFVNDSAGGLDAKVLEQAIRSTPAKHRTFAQSRAAFRQFAEEKLREKLWDGWRARSAGDERRFEQCLEQAEAQQAFKAAVSAGLENALTMARKQIVQSQLAPLRPVLRAWRPPEKLLVEIHLNRSALRTRSQAETLALVTPSQDTSTLLDETAGQLEDAITMELGIGVAALLTQLEMALDYKRSQRGHLRNQVLLGMKKEDLVRDCAASLERSWGERKGLPEKYPKLFEYTRERIRELLGEWFEAVVAEENARRTSETERVPLAAQGPETDPVTQNRPAAIGGKGKAEPGQEALAAGTDASGSKGSRGKGSVGSVGTGGVDSGSGGPGGQDGAGGGGAGSGAGAGSGSGGRYGGDDGCPGCRERDRIIVGRKAELDELQSAARRAQEQALRELDAAQAERDSFKDSLEHAKNQNTWLIWLQIGILFVLLARAWYKRRHALP